MAVNNFCILHMLNWSSASCLFDCTKNAPFFLDLRSTKYQVFFLIPIAPFCHSISICTVYSMHPLAWSKHYTFARPADCGLNAVALHENQRRPCSCLVWIFWFGYIISSRLPDWSFSPWYVYTVSFRFHLFGVVQVTCILKWEVVVNCTCTMCLVH